MKRSNFNIIIPVENESSIILNTLSGAIDIVSGKTAEYLGSNGKTVTRKLKDHLCQRQYLLEDDVDEKQLIRDVYTKLHEQKRKESTLHCILLLSFDCNLKCTYCWQQGQFSQAAPVKAERITAEKVNSIFRAIEELKEKVVTNRDASPTIQIFGGEPLIPANREAIMGILKKCHERAWPVQITTNGVFLHEYLDAIRHYDVREIQVTIDGPQKTHDKRRVGSQYRKLMDILDTLILDSHTWVKLRANVDMSNVRDLTGLADDIIDRQWYANRKFYAYIAPLRDSAGHGYQLLKTRTELLSTVLSLYKEHPKLEIFDMLGWDGYQPTRGLAFSGKFPYPRTHICEANMNQFVFTPNGEIHVCAEDAHNHSSSVGLFSPGFQLMEKPFLQWYDKSPLDVEPCKDCTVLPVCGGGCQLWIRNGGKNEEYCRTVKECFSMGLKHAYSSGELR